MYVLQTIRIGWFLKQRFCGIIIWHQDITKAKCFTCREEAETYAQEYCTEKTIAIPLSTDQIQLIKNNSNHDNSSTNDQQPFTRTTGATLHSLTVFH